MTDLRDLLDEWQRLADEATPGPWEWWAAHTLREDTPHPRRRHPRTVLKAQDDWSPSPEDAGFILAARTAVPALVAAVRAVLDLQYDDCPLGSTEGHEGWCGALDAARSAITDHLPRHLYRADRIEDRHAHNE